MQRQNKIFAAVQNRSGASLLFVLAIMMLLMAVGASALVAASATAGTSMSRQTGDRLDLLAESLHKTMMYSLQTAKLDEAKDDETKDIGDAETLGGQLLAVIYNAAVDPIKDATPSIDYYGYSDGIGPLALTPTLTGGELPADTTCSIELSIMPLARIVKGYTPEYFITDENGAVSKEDGTYVAGEAYIQAHVTVTIALTHNNGKKLTSIATYSCLDASLTESGTTMEITNAGKWELVSYEKLYS